VFVLVLAVPKVELELAVEARRAPTIALLISSGQADWPPPVAGGPSSVT